MPTLIKFSACWADEFTCEEFRIVEESVGTVREAISALIEHEHYFGTNEGFEKGELNEQDFKVRFISSQEAEIIKNHLGDNFGVGILSRLFDEDEEEADWDEEDLRDKVY